VSHAKGKETTLGHTRKDWAGGRISTGWVGNFFALWIDGYWTAIHADLSLPKCIFWPSGGAYPAWAAFYGWQGFGLNPP
jgi:hypothetical protein